MTIYTRPDEDVFAGRAKPGEVADFPNMERGWGEAVDRTGGKPPMEWFNWLGRRADSAVRYFMQRGVAEWSATEDYPVNAITVSNGLLYRALSESPTLPPEGNPKLWGALQGLTVARDDESESFATTRMVWAAIRKALEEAKDDRIGEIVFEMRVDPRPGYLVMNGAVLNRADYPQLWAYAQASGALVDEAEWASGRLGCFSTGDGAKSFRVPDFRGEFLRIWDGARGADTGRLIGSWQDSANRLHAHAASSSAAGSHGHDSWTDVQGWHGHHGWTSGVGDHQHVSPWGESTGGGYNPPWGTWGGNDKFGSNSHDNDNTWGMTSPAGGHAHEFNTDGSGNHGHNVGIGTVGDHIHVISVAGDGAKEARPRNIAVRAFIRAYL